MVALLISLVVISFSGVMAPGPMFAVTLARGYSSPWAGALMALGHAVVEVPLILLIYFSLGRLFEKSAVQIVLSIIGGVMIVWMGIDMFRSRKKVATGAKDIKGTAFISGILMSGLNPFFLLWWATTGSLLISRFVGYGFTGMLLFTLAHWSCDLIWLSFVSVLIYKTRGLWGTRVQEVIFIVCSALLIYFGGNFLLSGIQMMG